MRTLISTMYMASAALLLAACSPASDESAATQDEAAAPQTAAPATVAPASQTSPVQQNPVESPAASASFLVYVTNEDSNNVTVIDGDTHNVLQTIDIGKRPRGLKVSPDGRLLYVAVSGAPKCPPTMDDEECEKLEVDLSADGIAEVDTATRTVRRVLPSGLDPEQFDLNWETGLMYVANENANLASILDVANGTILQTVETGREPEGVRVSPDGKVAYVTGEVDSDITVIDTAT